MTSCSAKAAGSA